MTTKPTPPPAHTPGPWEVEPSGNVVGKAGHLIAVVTRDISVSSIQSVELSEANARLIAAAPDLLETLTGLLENLDMDGPSTADDPDDDSVGRNGDGSEMSMTFGHIRRARVAIAKATQYGQRLPTGNEGAS